MEFELLPIADKPQRPAIVSAQTHYGRAGKARANDQALIAGYEAGCYPGAWDHIGEQMRADAPPVITRRRWLGRTTERRDHVIRFRVAVALALLAAALMVLNTTPGKP